MTIHGLTDIDSLALSVRDPESKRLIGEATSAYRGGALRSAIVSTWIAVDYDIIAKARVNCPHWAIPLPWHSSKIWITPSSIDP